MLTGPEVRSLRSGKATVAESYAALDRNGELFLYNANIPTTGQPLQPRAAPGAQAAAARQGDRQARQGRRARRHDDRAVRVYFNAKGRAKVALALARGKQLHDKREAEKTRDRSRDNSRLMRQRG